MRKLSTLLFFAATLVALPAHAADRTEVIPLAFISAPELDMFLTGGGFRVEYASGLGGQVTARGMGGLGGKSAPDMIPKAISAWAVDARKNTLSVTGSDEAIGQLKQIVRLLDIPARQVRMRVHLVQLDAAAAAALQVRPEVLDRDGMVTLTLTKAEDRKLLEARSALLSTDLNVTNNRMLYLRVPGAAAEEARSASLIPRVNGDGSITVIASALLTKNFDDGKISVVFRVASGQTEVVIDRERRAWMITPELLPDPSR